MSGMKLDLDDLERKARAAAAESPGWWRRGGVETDVVFAQCDDGLAPAIGRVLLRMNQHVPNALTAEYIAAVNPATALALIARIRELEQQRADLIGRLACLAGHGGPKRMCRDAHHEDCPLHGLSDADLKHAERQ